MRHLACVAALVAVSACSARIHEGQTVWYDEGGRVDTYEAWAATPKRIAGTCISACTIYLRTGCVEPGATLVFHPPGFPTFEPKAVHDYWAERIARNYPAAIAAWYLSDYGKTRMKSGAWAIEKGAKACQTIHHAGRYASRHVPDPARGLSVPRLPPAGLDHLADSMRCRACGLGAYSEDLHMTLAQLIEAGLKAEIAQAGRTITDPAALQRWMSDHGIGRSAMSAATGADFNAVQNKERAGVRGPQATGTDAYERLSQPLTHANFPGDATRWEDWVPKDILIERLGKALEMMRHPHAHWIVDLYVEHDGRFPDASGFDVWTELLDDGEPTDAVRGWIVGGFAK